MWKLLDSIEAIETIKEKKEKSVKIMHNLKEIQIEPKLIISENPKTYSFSLDLKTAKNKNKNKVNLFNLDSEISISNNKRIKIKHLNIQIRWKEEFPNKYYSKIDLKENSLCRLKTSNKIVEIVTDSSMHNLNDFVILNGDNNDKTDKIYMELTLWKETNKVSKFIKDTNDTIKSQIQNLINKI